MSSALLPGESCHSEWCEVRRSGIHGRGVFATKDIPAQTPVIEYLGERIDKEESDLRGWAQMDKHNETGEAAVYIFTLDDDWDIDGDVPENAARLINHGCDVNCEAYIEGSGLHLLSVSDRSELPDSGESLVVIALVAGELAIRIFDGSGRQVIDKSGRSLTDGKDYSDLVHLLSEGPLPDMSTLSSGERQEIIDKATLICGHSHIEDRSILIWSIREIKKDEELLFNYGFDLENWEDHPCICGADCCPGYIAGMDYWDELKEKVAEKKRLEMAVTARVGT